MTPLRSQMIEEMLLRGYAQSTIEGYVHAIAQLARAAAGSGGFSGPGEV